MKKIIITEKQLFDFIKLDETVQQYINKKPGETIDNAIKTAAREVAQDAPNADVDFVIPKEEVNETVDVKNNVVDEVTNFIINNWGDEFENGSLTMSQVKDMIQDAYIEITGEEIDYNDKNIYREIHYKLMDYVMGNRMNNKTNESVSITKKQIKEYKVNKRIAESKIYTKKDLQKSHK